MNDEVKTTKRRSSSEVLQNSIKALQEKLRVAKEKERKQKEQRFKNAYIDLAKIILNSSSAEQIERIINNTNASNLSQTKKDLIVELLTEYKANK